MKPTPTSGPVRSSMAHHARADHSSRHSFSGSHDHAALREGKEDPFQVAGRFAARRGHGLELGKRPLAADAPVAEEDEAIAQARGLDDLMDGEEEGAPAG